MKHLVFFILIIIQACCCFSISISSNVPKSVFLFFSFFVSHSLTTQIPNNLWTGPAPGSSVVSSCMIPRGSPPCVTSPYPHSPRAAEHGYVGFPNHQQNQFGVNHVSLNNFFADSLLAPSPNSHAAFETKPEFERRSSSIAVLRMKAKEHAANITWAM